MEGFGWVLFALGSILIVISGVLGSSTISSLVGAGTRVATLSGVLIGSSMMISGAIFAAVGELTKEIKSSRKSPWTK